jgi:hemerythrin
MKVALISWSNSLSVNIKKFDDQHMKLVNMVNQLHEAMKVGKGREMLGQILQSLADYTNTHFRDEEQLMKLHNYPEYEEHKKEHNVLLNQVRETAELHRQGKNILSQDIMNFLKNWLTGHILDRDKKYGPHLNEKGVK